MKNLLLDNLIRDLQQISSMHDNCLDETLRLYNNQNFDYTNIEQSITKSVSIDKKQVPERIILSELDTSDIHFREEYDNKFEMQGTTNSLMIETAPDIEI